VTEQTTDANSAVCDMLCSRLTSTRHATLAHRLAMPLHNTKRCKCCGHVAADLSLSVSKRSRLTQLTSSPLPLSGWKSKYSSLQGPQGPGQG